MTLQDRQNQIALNVANANVNKLVSELAQVCEQLDKANAELAEYKKAGAGKPVDAKVAEVVGFPAQK